MKKIIFITSGSIKYQFSGLSLYDSIQLTARGRRYPHLNFEGFSEIQEVVSKFSSGVDHLFFAPSHQCRETAKFIDVSSSSLDYLLPLKFDLSQIISQSDFEKNGHKSFDILRRRYLRAFFNDQLLETNREVKKRYHKLLDVCPHNSTTLVVSHAYLIKQLEAYHLHGDKIYTNYQQLAEVFMPEVETMSRLQTIEIFIN